MKEKILENFDKMIELKRENDKLLKEFKKNATEEDAAEFMAKMLLKLQKIYER